MRSLYCVGYPQGTSRLEFQTWFSKYGSIQCLEFYRARAYICFEDEMDAEDAMRGLHNKKLEHGCRLRVYWARRECTRRHDDTPSKLTPSKTLFVFNFDPKSDLKQYFKRFGTVLDVNICKDEHAYVDFAHQEHATKALEAAHMSKLGAKVLKVDYKDTHTSVSQREREVPRPLHRSPHYNTYRARRSRSPGARSPHYSRNDNSRARRSRTPGSPSPNYNSYRARRSRSPGSRSPNYNSYRARRSRSPGSWSPHYSRNDNSRARRSRSPDSCRNDSSRARRSPSRQ